MGPLECSKCSHECSGSFGIITVGIDGIASVKWLEGYIRITKFLLVFLTLAYVLLMPRETAPIDMTSCIPKVVDVCLDILIDFLVVLATVVDMVPLAPPRRGCLSSRCWLAKKLLLGQRLDLGDTDRRFELVK